MKRLMAGLLVILLLITGLIIDIPNVNAIERDNIYEGNLDNNAMIQNMTLPSGISKYNSKGIPLNIEIFIDKGIAVYGDYAKIPNNDFKYSTERPNGEIVKNEGYYSKNEKKGEYRYHGYTVDGNKYTNEAFPPDKTSGRSLESKNWVYRSWKVINGEERSLYNQFAIEEKNQYARDLMRQKINSIVNFSIENGIHSDGSIVRNTDNEPDATQTFNFANMLSAPTAYSVGETKMWHKKGSKYWYQTFSTGRPEQVETDIECNVQILNSGNYIIGAGETSTTVRVKVTGILKDEEYYNDDIKKILYYTRDDLKKAEITLNGVTKTALINGNEAYVIFDVKVNRNDLNMNNEKLFVGEVKFTYYDNKKGTVSHSSIEKIEIQKIIDENIERQSEALECDYYLSKSVTTEGMTVSSFNYYDNSLGDITGYNFVIKELSTGNSHVFNLGSNINNDYINSLIYNFVKNKESVMNLELGESANFKLIQTIVDTEDKIATKSRTLEIINNEPPKFVEPNLNIPDKAFDVIGFKTIDNTDLEFCTEKKVLVDGREVDYNYFFSGNYEFGKITSVNNTELHKVGIYYISEDDIETQYEKWIYVYNTTPKVQIKLGGYAKENRKIVLENTSEEANEPYLLQHYPISYTWKFEALNDSNIDDFKTKVVGEDYHALAKKEGEYKVTLIGENPLGYKDEYELPFSVQKDHTPAMILNIWNNVLARTEEVNVTQDYVSVDDDNITKQEITIYYDENQDGVAEKELIKMNAEDFTNYSPDKLGKYTIKVYVEESFGQETISEFLDGTETVSGTIKRDLFVDNLRPLTEVYLDIPINFPRVDLMIMRDKDLEQNKNDELVSNRINYDNSLRESGINPIVKVWDMKTYEYFKNVTKSRHTGDSYPSATIIYSSNGYYGKLSRYDVDNDLYWVDNGYWDTKEVCSTTYVEEKVFEGEQCVDSCDFMFDYTEAWCRTVGCVDIIEVPVTTCTDEDYWVSDMVEKNDYTGKYRGTVYKYIRQDYENFWESISDKYVIYLSDIGVNETSSSDHNGRLSNLKELDDVLNEIDCKLILIGDDSIKSDVTEFDYFIKNDGSDINTLINQALDIIKEENPFTAQYITTIDSQVNIRSVDLESENDGISEFGYQYIQNTSYFDNTMGMEDFSISYFSESNWTSYVPNKFSKVGIYEIHRQVKDVLPDNYISYEKQSNASKVTLLVHRKPIADAKLDWDYDPVTSKYKTTWLDLSKDLDHEFSHPDKGIVERKIKYRRNLGEWKYKIPVNLEPGDYELQYYVKDIEGAWSDPFIMNFTLDPAPPIQFDALARTLDNKLSLSSVPVSEYLEFYNIWTRYPYPHKLQVSMFDNTTKVGSDKTINYYSGNKTDNDINWNNITYQIPDTLPDKNYILNISAIDSNNNSVKKEKNFSITLSTPVELVITKTPLEFVVDEENIIEVETSKYVDEVEITFYKETSYEGRYNMTFKNISGEDGNKKTWEYTHIPPKEIIDGDYVYEVRATTTNNNSETLTQNYKTIGLKLEKLRIVNIADFNWKDEFKKSNGQPTELEKQGIGVKDFPVYRDDEHKYIKLGYRVFLEIDSTGLHKSGDTIDIELTYYALDRSYKLHEVDIYVPDENYNYHKLENTEYVNISSNLVLNDTNKRTYETDITSQNKNTWNFSTFLPATAKVVKKGESLDLFNDNTFNNKLLVIMNIKGIKSTGAIYDYTDKEMNWAVDDGSIYGENLPTDLDLGKGVNHGEIFWYDLNETLLDDIDIEQWW